MKRIIRGGCGRKIKTVIKVECICVWIVQEKMDTERGGRDGKRTEAWLINRRGGLQLNPIWTPIINSKINNKFLYHLLFYLFLSWFSSLPTPSLSPFSTYHLEWFTHAYYTLYYCFNFSTTPPSYYPFHTSTLYQRASLVCLVYHQLMKTHEVEIFCCLYDVVYTTIKVDSH